MNPSKAEVRLSANFERNLEGIEQFLVDAGAAQTFDALLDGLLNEVIPNLEDFPAMGALFMDRQGNSVEVRRALSVLHAKLPPNVEIRNWLWSDYLLLYSWNGEVVNLLSIRHHRQLAFDLHSVWK